MALDLKDIDPRIADALQERVRALTGPFPRYRKQERLARAALEKHVLKPGIDLNVKLLVETVGFLLGGGLILSAALSNGHPLPFLTGAFCVLVAILFALAVPTRTPRRVKKGESQHYHAEVLSALAPLLELTPAERRYCDLLVVCAEETTPLDAQAARDLLQQLNLLLRDSRELEAQRKTIEATLGPVNVAEMEAEREKLALQAGAVTDPVVKQAKDQSLEMLDARLRDARAVGVVVERLRAQEEAICQTLSTMRSTLARLQTAPAPLAAPDAANLRETVTQITNRTRAVEQAVQEVMTLRAS